MKKMKKIFALLITMVMVLGMSTMAFAGTIEVQDVLDGETYTAYKILNYTKNGDAYSYYLTAAEYDANEDGTAKDGGLGDILQDAGFAFTKSADGSQYFVNNAEALTTSGVSDVAAALGADTRLPGKALATKTATGASGKAEFTDLATGYYFITSSAGSLTALHDDNGIATVVEKNTMITDTKVVDEKSKNAQVGDVLTYTVTLTDGKGTNLEAKIIDTISKGLTYNNDATATANGQPLTKGTDFTVTTKTLTAADVAEGADYEGQQVGATVVTYTFTAAVITKLEESQKIVVTYTATVNDDASIDGTVSNTEYTQYSKQETTPNTVTETLTDMTVNKTDGKDALKGAQFKLYRTDSAQNLTHVDVKLRQLTDAELTAASVTKADDTVYYTVDPEGTNLIDMAQKNGDNYLYSSAVVYGLDKDSTYYLEETKAPEGYNLLDKEETVNLGSTTSIDVVNNAGSVLPSTGGIGTTIFYIIGAILVIGAGVVLVTRRRMNAQ